MAPIRRVGKLLRGHASGASDLDETIWALRDVSFEVKRGEVIGIIGHNGAGKSTLLKILSRITEPTAGYADVSGRVGSLLEVGTGFHAELTGRENIFLSGAILGMKRAEIARKFDEIVSFAEIARFIDTPVKHYSTGMRVRLGFAVAAHLEPEILLIDEVLAVGDSRFQKKCLGKMGMVAQSGRTVLFVSHNMAAIRSLCDKGIVLARGRIAASDEVDTVVDAYQSGFDVEEAQPNSSLPMMNYDYGAGIMDCRADVSLNGDGTHTLTIEIDVRCDRPISNLGVGISLSTLNDVLISKLGPSVTGYGMERAQGDFTCVFTREAIDAYISGGSYKLGVWLSFPNTEYIVKAEDVLLVSIPAPDLFGTARPFEYRKQGVVPLPVEFTVKEA
jgi:lipopolysaccharide transport system ATP-binding protein